MNIIKKQPIITFMGHVNHGKTSLIDKICKTNIVKKEIGNITQAITAYIANTTIGQITLLDTPGHEAFENMRIRGIKCTDIIILVIAADDGIMPQTKEIITYALKQKIPIIIAINKIDKIQNDNIKKITTDLAALGIISEEWGGDFIIVHTSTKHNIGIDKLLDAIKLHTEILELTTKSNEKGKGVVLESQIDKGYGITANILLHTGVLKKGDILLIGTSYTKVRCIFDTDKNEIKKVQASVPFSITNITIMPKAGEVVEVTNHTVLPKKIQQTTQQTTQQTNLINVQKQHNIIIKAKTYGSAEAIVNAIKKLSTNNNNITIIAIGTGNFYESDVKHASITNSCLYGFGVTCNVTTKKIAKKEGVQIKLYNVIYDIVKDIKNLTDKIDKKSDIQITGTARIKTIFKLSNNNIILGCEILTGIVKLNDHIEIKNGDEVCIKTKIITLQHFNEKIKEAKKGTECGIGIQKVNADIEKCIQKNDIILVQK